ncbi:MAG TPA: hypothetical protein ACFYD5_06275 [Candidatus Tripitaka sp. YC43]
MVHLSLPCTVPSLRSRASLVQGLPLTLNEVKGKGQITRRYRNWWQSKNHRTNQSQNQNLHYRHSRPYQRRKKPY